MAELIYRPAPAPLPPPQKTVAQQAEERLIYIASKTRLRDGPSTVTSALGGFLCLFLFPIGWPIASFVAFLTCMDYWACGFAFLVLFPTVVLPCVAVFWLTEQFWASWLMWTGNIQERSPHIPIAERVDAYFNTPGKQSTGEWAWAVSRGHVLRTDLSYNNLTDHANRFLKELVGDERAAFYASPVKEQVVVICKRALFLELSSRCLQ